MQPKQFNLLLLILCLLAAISFLLTLNLPLVGEEGVYTNGALEMIFNKQYKFATLYGNIYPRPPLYNWLIILVNNIFSPKNIVLSARVVTMLSTIIMSIMTFIVARTIFSITHHNQQSSKLSASTFALFTTLIFLSGDLLFKRGWLAYSDPTFSMFVFTGMALLLLATIKNSLNWIFFANICIFLGFLSKTYTSYVFYGLTFLAVLLVNKKYRSFLLAPRTILLHLLFFIPLIGWSKYFTEAKCFCTIMDHIKNLLGFTNNPESNLFKNLISFPLQTWVALLPSSLIILFAIQKIYYNKIFLNTELITKTFKNYLISKPIINILFLIILLNFIPYWVTSQSNIRYLMPIYPWFSILMAYLIWQAELVKINTICLLIGIIFKFLVAIFWFPYEYSVIYGNAEIIAKDLLKYTAHYPLFINSDSAAGLRVAGAINKIRWPKQPLKQIVPNNIGHSYYFIIQENIQSPNQNIERHLIKIYKLKNDQIVLYKQRNNINNNM